MKTVQDILRPTSVALAVLALLPCATRLHAAQSASLSVQASATSGTPQVRGVRRETVDNERIQAAPNETVELLLADGTSLTLSPGSSVMVERYRYDRGAHVGELRMRVDSGTVRTVGGVLNNTSLIQVSTPGGAASLDNAVAFVQVNAAHTELTLVAGRSIAVKAGNETRVLDKPGTSIAFAPQGSFESQPHKLAAADSQRLTTLVNPGLVSGVVPTFVQDARNVDTSGGAASAVATTTTTTTGTQIAETGTGEDATAKDVKITPPPPSIATPALPCSSGACFAATPNFDLGESIGAVGNRQSGQTVGASWLQEYNQGQPLVGALGAVNAPKPDYNPAGGFRNTTARVFASDPTTPYALTLSAAHPATQASGYDSAAFACATGGCQASPIVNLYDISLVVPGAFYRFAGNDDSSVPIDTISYKDHASEMLIALPTSSDYNMTSDPGQRFGTYPILASVPFDPSSPGVMQSRNVNVSLEGCLHDGVASNPCTFTWSSKAERDAAVQNSTLPRPDQADPFFAYPFGGSSNGSLFASQQVHIVNTPGGTDLEGDISFTGTSAYTIRTLLAGFTKVGVTNTASSLQQICTLSTPGCADLAENLFGFDNVNGVPNVSLDENNLDYPIAGDFVAKRADDSFLAVEAISKMPGDNQRLFFATGSVSARLGAGVAAQGATLDRFKLSPGLNLDVSEPLGRAFLRPTTLLNISPSALLSSDLLVLNSPYTTTVASPSRALQYDFAAVGSGNDQTSTLSVTLGSLAYDPASKSAELTARTVGSTERSGSVTYTGSVESALFSTAAGGGNANLAGTGRAGYLVLENYDPTSAPNGGLERTIENGAATSTNYAVLRMGQVVANGTSAAPARTSSTGLTGYVGGIAEVTQATGTQTSVSIVPMISNTLQLQTNATQGSVAASFSANVGGTAATNLSLGGTTGLSAFTDAKEYAAMTAAAPNLGAGAITDASAPNAAIISGATLVGTPVTAGGTTTQGWTIGLDADTRDRLAAGTAKSYKYLQWGFFFGDYTTAANSSAHSHLNSWIAGTATPSQTPLPTGQADYAGHVFANISNGARLYSAAGTYANHWDFAKRSGNGAMSLDGQNYDLVTRMVGLGRVGTQITSTSTTQFEGLISASGNSTSVGSLNGTFVAPPASTSTDPLVLRSALMGQFAVDRTLNGAAYRAVGTFGAELKGPQ